MAWNSTTWVKSTKNLLLPKSNKEMQRKQQKKIRETKLQPLI